MNKTAAQIFEERTAEDGLVAIIGNHQAIVSKIASYESGSKGDMVFAPNQSALEKAITNQVSLIVAPEKLVDSAMQNLNGTAIISSENIAISHAKIKQKYGEHDYSQSGWEAIHPTAVIHESVTIPTGTTIGPNAVIEKGVTLGTHCSIMANVVIEHGATIGNNVTIHPGTIIGWDCRVGDDCLLLSNSVIGGEGFGYAQDQYFLNSEVFLYIFGGLHFLNYFNLFL